MMILATTSVTLQPSQVLPIAVTASVFSCASATESFNVSFDGGAFIPIVAGWSVDNRPHFFKSIILQNPNATAITITFYATTCAISYSPVTNQVVSVDAPTYTVGYNVISAITQLFDGKDWGNKQNQRKQIIITNIDATNPIQVADANGRVLAQILAGQAWTAESNGGFTILNAYGCSYLVGEIFYV
jgi:hypothetical protein